MKLIDSRRLMGPNRVSRLPTAIAEVECEDAAVFEIAWRKAAQRMLDRLGWNSALSARAFHGGIELALSAPIDVLLAATDVNDWAIYEAAGEAPPLQARALEIEAMIAEQASPRLLEIEREARERDVPFLWDDDEISLGLGQFSRTWKRNELPARIEWSSLKRIPVAMITGTNGKTTSSRLLARMCKEAGLVCGNTATDGISVDGVRETQGDYTGPVAARTILRDPRVQIAILETARGGILRRGLAMDQIDVALITNVSEDHMGSYGIDDLEEMVRTKTVLAHAVRPGGTVVLNGEDASLNKLTFAVNTSYFHHSDVRDGMFFIGATPLCAVNDAPITFSGRARYNIENALGCILVASALGLPAKAIAAGLTGFKDNPGRSNLYDVHGVQVMLDFAHNPKAIDAILSLTALLPRKGRLIIITGGAGDRLDEDLRLAAAPLAAVKPAHVFCRDLQGYLRGRTPGEVPAIIRDELLRRGLREDQVSIAADEVDALTQALAMAEPGDLILMLVHLQPEPVQALLRQHGV